MNDISDDTEATSSSSSTMFVKNHKRRRMGNIIVPEDKITDKILKVFKIKGFKDEIANQIKNRY